MDNNPFKSYKKPLLAVIGNPLLDILVPIPSMKYLEDCNISGKKLLEDHEFNTLFDSIRRRKDLATWPGGSAQITAQLFQWIVDIPGYTVMMGCIGPDNYGKTMEKLVQSIGVETKYTIVSGKRTGICMSLVCGKDRATVANLGASTISSSPDTFFTKEFIDLLKKVQIVYVEGFFVTHGYLSMMEVVSLCKSHGTYLVVNLSAVNVMKDYHEKILQVLKNSEIVFGNKEEFATLSKMCEWNAHDTKEIIKSLIKHSHVRPDKFKRQSLPELFHQSPTIVVTDGSRPVTIGHGSKRPPMEYALAPMDTSKIKDDTGGGDAFVAGFLAAAVLGLDLKTCVTLGSQMANTILQQWGIKMPRERPDWLKNILRSAVRVKK